MLMLAGVAVACTMPPIDMVGETLNKDDWTQINIGSAAQACTNTNFGDESNQISCCNENFAGTKGNISGVIGNEIGGLKIVNGAFNVTFNVSTSETGGSSRVFFGLVNTSDDDNILIPDGTAGSINGSIYVVQAPSAGNSVSLFCNGVSLYDSASLSDNAHMILKIDKGTGNPYVNLTFNTSGGGLYNGGCAFPDDNQIYLPYSKTQSYGVSAASECMLINVFASTSNQSFKVRFKTLDALTELPISNCTILNALGLYGSEPYWNQSITETAENGVSPYITYYPHCDDISYEGYFDYACDAGYADSRGLSLDGDATYEVNVTTAGAFCLLYATVRYPNNSYSKDASIRLKQEFGGEPIPYINLDNITYEWPSLPCQYYDVLLKEEPTYLEAQVDEDVYPLGQTLSYTLPEQAGFAQGPVNVTVNIRDYTTLNVNETVVRVYNCIGDDPYNDCLDGPFKPETLLNERCELKTGWNGLALGGTWFGENLNMEVGYVCAQVMHDNRDYPDIRNMRKAESISYGQLITGWDVQYEFNFSFAMSNIGREICLAFEKFGTDELVPNVNITMWQDGRLFRPIQSSGTTVKGFCYNETRVTEAARTFILGFQKENYKPVNNHQNLLTWGPAPNIWKLKAINQSAEQRYNISGSALKDGVGVANIMVAAECEEWPDDFDITSATGEYNITAIGSGVTCWMSVIDAGYDSEKKSVTVWDDVTDFDLVITEKETSTYPVKLTVQNKPTYLFERGPVEGAEVTITREGGYQPSSPCVTDVEGTCEKEVHYGESYGVVIFKKDYKRYDGSRIMKGNRELFTIELDTGKFCSIQGHVYSLNTSLNVTKIPKEPLTDVKMTLWEGGYRVDSTETEVTVDPGRYTFFVKCETEYMVKAEWQGQEIDTKVKTGPDDSSIDDVDFEFILGQLTVNQQYTNAVNFFISILLPATYIIGLLFIVMIIKMLYKGAFG